MRENHAKPQPPILTARLTLSDAFLTGRMSQKPASTLPPDGLTAAHRQGCPFPRLLLVLLLLPPALHPNALRFTVQRFNTPSALPRPFALSRAPTPPKTTYGPYHQSRSPLFHRMEERGRGRGGALLRGPITRWSPSVALGRRIFTLFFMRIPPLSPFAPVTILGVHTLAHARTRFREISVIRGKPPHPQSDPIRPQIQPCALP